VEAPSSVRSVWINISFVVVIIMAMYSASVKDLEIVDCFLEDQDIKVRTKKYGKIYSWTFVIRAACLISITKGLKMYRPISKNLFHSLQWQSNGCAKNCETLFTAKVRYDLVIMAYCNTLTIVHREENLTQENH
jgi:heme/copper-type cytochrome/quinol oxidase subunit 2